MSKVLICGGREFKDSRLLNNILNRFQRKYSPITLVIQGDARGADSLGKLYAKQNNIPVESFPAKWDVYGRSAGIRRNELMLAQNPDYVIGFFGGRGTAHMLKIAREKKVRTFHIDKTMDAHGGRYIRIHDNEDEL